jgi:DNA repair protein RecN (Recombination protein N)
MLKELIVRNIVLIEKLHIEFEKGLSVLTGETGTGKSILLDSLGLITGNRVDYSLIRNGETEASVTAIFYLVKTNPVKFVLKKYNIETENEIIIRRSIKSDGKSRCYINDILVTRNILVEVADYLIEIQGQFEERGLLDTKTHISILDVYCNHSDLLKKTKSSFEKMAELKRIIKETEIDEDKINKDNEWLKDSFNQLNLLDPQFNEEEGLDKQKKVLMNNEKIIVSVNQVKSLLEEENGLEDLNYKILRTLEGIKNFGLDNINNGIDIVERTKVELEELRRILNNEISFANDTKYNLEDIEDRLYELRSQARKHNCTVDELISVKDQISSKLQIANTSKQKLHNLKIQLEQAKKQFTEESNLLSNSRKNGAIKLCNAINHELPDLKLERAKFKIKFDELQIENASHLGVDNIVFLASTNTGAVLLPINKVASGGELSRFLLAIKVVLESVTYNRTVIFDEIDSGIGGQTANAVGIRLARMGKAYQTMVVTHSPQVTSKGNYHYLVQKKDTNKGTITNVQELNSEQRVEEIARMLAGNSITDEARKAAAKLLNNK